MALPLQELVSVSQDETSPLLREETSLRKEETLSTQYYVPIVSVAAKRG